MAAHIATGNEGGDGRPRTTARRTRAGVASVVSLVLAASVTLVGVAPAYGGTTGTGTSLFDQSFQDSTLSSTGGAVALPTSPSGTNVACLTAAGGGAVGPLPDCTSANDASGSGVLRLTSASGSAVGGVFAATSVPTSQGLDLQFTTHQWGGSGADGIGFVLAAANPTAPVAPPNFGQSGGSLGYPPYGGSVGLADAYLGIGLDAYGNFSNDSFQGSPCGTDPAYITSGNNQVPGQVVVRGPGNRTTGYCAINSTATSTSSPALTLRDGTSRGTGVPVEVVINPTASAFTASTDSSVSVPSGHYAVVFTPLGGSQRALTGTLPTNTSGLGIPSSWLGANGIPKQLTFGWVASTGGSTDNHEIALASVNSINPVAKFAPPAQTVADEATASGGTSTVPVGDPVTYTVPVSLQSGADEQGPVTVTDTLPAGVTPVSGSGTGWVCEPPSGQSVSCSNSHGPFTAGTSLPSVTIDATVTGSGGVAESAIQSATVTTASADDSAPGYSTTASPVAPPSSPSITVSPAAGPAAGGNGPVTVSGTNLTGATQIEIGTAAEIAAGVGDVLVPCTSDVTTNCFTSSTGTLSIASMPAHADGATQLVVTTQGVSGSTGYNYQNVPAAPTAVTASAGDTTANVSWTAGATNGTPVTGWTVTPYIGGTAQTAGAVNLASATPMSATVTGLTPGTTYTFQVVATSAAGDSPTGASNQATTNAAVAVSTTTLADGEVNVGGYHQTLAATGGTGTYTWAVTSGALPTGLTLNGSTGIISGTPTTAETSNFTVTATDAQSEAASKSLGINVVPDPSVTTTSLPAGERNATYSQALAESGGTGPFSWSLANGTTLPGGLTLSPSGTLSGAPTATGTSSFTVLVTDADGKSATQALSLTVGTDPSITTTSLPDGELSANYDQTLTESGGSGPFTWSLPNGSTLPAGLSLSLSGRISGAPTSTGSYAFSVQVTDAASQSSTQSYTVTVDSVPSITTTSLSAGEVSAPYSQTLTATGGSGGYTWSVTAGGLPDGLSLSSGTISGSPTAIAVSSTFTVTVTDTMGVTASRPYTLTIVPAPAITTPSPLAVGEVGASYTQPLAEVGGTGPFGWAVTGGALPGGLHLDASTGAITGTPTASGPSSFTVTLTDADLVAATHGYTLDVNPPPSITTSSLPAGELGAPYSSAVAATDGTPGYAWSITAGSLPAGLHLDASSGAITGSPTATGTSAFTVGVTDTNGRAATHAESITIVGDPTVTTSALPGGEAGAPYPATTLAEGGGTGPFTWSVPVGTVLTPGLSLSPTGVLAGTPAAAGTGSVTVAVTDAHGKTATRTYSLVVGDDPLIATTTLPGGQSGSRYDAPLAEAGGTGPYTWSAPDGLPAGLTLSASGVLSGTPARSGTSSVTVEVTDANGRTAMRTFTLDVVAPLRIVPVRSPRGLTMLAVGSRVHDQLHASGGHGPYTWIAAGGALPPGLRLTRNGVLSGTPSRSGSYRFTVEVIDAAGAVRRVTLRIDVPSVDANSRMIAGTGDDRGYWVARADGRVTAFGSAPQYRSVSAAQGDPVVAIYGNPIGTGYWLARANGQVAAFGGARTFRATGQRIGHRKVIGLVGTPDGRGYWLFSSDGTVLTYGDAGYHGSSHGRLTVGMAATSTGRGYWLVSAAGQVSAFGDARNHGSLHTPHAGTVVGMAASPTNRGYDLVTSEGRVLVFGDARFWGDATNLYLAAPVVAIALAPGGRGYWLVAADGGVFTYGESRFYGANPPRPPGPPSFR